MNTEMLTKSGELSDDELGRVTGGLDDDTATAAANILCALPVFGAVASTTRVIVNAIHTATGGHAL